MPRRPRRGSTRQIPTRFTREVGLTIDRAAMEARDEGDDRIPICLSSEAPVLRTDWWEDERYFEVLDHSAEAVDLSYAADGMPLLLEHYRGDQIGLLEDITVDADRRLRAMARFSRAAKAQEIKQDIVDGIRTKVSVGYMKSDTFDQVEGENGAPPTRRYRWTPMEGSIVSIPADYSVGVGRSGRAAALREEETMDDEDEELEGNAADEELDDTDEETDEELAAADEDVEDGEDAGEEEGVEDEDEPRSAGRATLQRRSHPGTRAAHAARRNTVSARTTAPGSGSPTVNAGKTERERATAILARAKEHRIPQDRAMAWVAEGKSLDEVNAEILADYQRGQRPITPQAPDEALRLTDQEERRYSIVRAMAAVADGNPARAGFEYEVSQELGKRLGKQTRGILVPTTLRASMPGALTASQALDGVRAIDPHLAQRTLLSVGGANKGAELKFTEYGSFIDLLRSRTTVLQLGAQMLSGLQGDLGFVEQTAAGTFTWGAETANAALSSASLGLRTMSPKIGQSATTYSRQLLAQAVIDVENLVRMDLAAIHARGIDAAAISGTGAASQPRGITNTVGIGSVAGGVNGAQPTWDNMVALQREVAVDNAFFGALAYLTTPGVAARLMLTQKFATTNGDPVWNGNILDGQIGGIKSMASTQVPSNLTKGTANGICHAVIFGAFDSILIGEWGAMEILVDPYTSGPTVVKVMSIQMLDVFLRYAVAFAAMLDALQ